MSPQDLKLFNHIFKLKNQLHNECIKALEQNDLDNLAYSDKQWMKETIEKGIDADLVDIFDFEALCANIREFCATNATLSLIEELEKAMETFFALDLDDIIGVKNANILDVFDYLEKRHL